ncbi:patatin-like phospholipase family protein [Brucepastera parasyntrophica]|uniref:patatin-like phospholipase family protein n=1 Tax=Brucepastera parasyntrophica TaxID=2880008 RepID=UPI00210C09A5|nr:patatin-like phospholipase family protein [Brucepastera parasyntrophica]ULQ60663.1 patatin-like phospholipase family protein [Brucepastera parasyntrophica]
MQNAGRPQVAIVLASGSAWGLAHIGAIRVIEELGIPVDMVVGTSIGSIVGGMYASGYSVDEIQHVFETTNWQSLFWEEKRPENESYTIIEQKAKYALSVNFDRYGLSFGKGFLPGDNILRMLDTYFLRCPSPVHFDELPRRFRAVATDSLTGERVVLSQGHLSDSIRASMSIPGVFSPWYIDGRYLVDGVMSDKLPINVAKEAGADIIIAIDLVDSEGYRFENNDITGGSDLILTRQVQNQEKVLAQIHNADIYIPIDIKGFTITDFDKVVELSEVGRLTALKYEKELQKILVRTGEENPANIEAEDTRQVFSLFLTEDTTLEIVGAVNNDREHIENKFYSLVGTVSDVEAINSLYNTISRTRRYQTVRMRRHADPDKNTLVIILERKNTERNTLRVNFLYYLSLSSRGVVGLDVIPAVFLNGLTTKGSQLVIDAKLLDMPGIDISFTQPLGNLFALRAFFSYQQDSIVEFSFDHLGYQYNTNVLSTGADLSLYPVGGVLLRAGWKFDLTNTHDFPDSGFFTAEKNALHTAYAMYHIRRFDTPIFASRGFMFNIDYEVSLKQHTASEFFQTIKGEGQGIIPFGAPFSMSLRWKAGTDLNINNISNRAPFYYLPSITSRWMFPAPLKTDEERGSLALGAVSNSDTVSDGGTPGSDFPTFCCSMQLSPQSHRIRRI